MRRWMEDGWKVEWVVDGEINGEMDGGWMDGEDEGWRD